MIASPLPSTADARHLIADARDGAALSALANDWRATAGMTVLLPLAEALWTDGSDAERIVAAKLLTKARIDDDDAIWTLLCAWAEALDAITALPALYAAGARRLSAQPDRIGEIESWLASENSLTRAAALGFAQGLAKDRHPASAVAQARTVATGWAATLAGDPAPAPRRAAADFLLSLAKHDPDRVAGLIEAKDALPSDLIERLKRAARL
jgi:hypothetical protein